MRRRTCKVFHLSLHLCVAALAAAGAAEAAPSRATCRKPIAVVDQQICGSSELVAMDHEIAALYERGMAGFGVDDQLRLKDSQTKFLARRKDCGWAAHHSAHPGVAVEECVRNAMESRVRGLRGVVDRGRF